jgi:hypothetical protein
LKMEMFQALGSCARERVDDESRACLLFIA